MPKSGFLLIICAAVAMPAISAKGVHLWYDENGQPVFSQFAPKAGTDSTKVKPPPPPAESPEVARARLQRQLQELEDRREDQALTDQKATKAASDRQRSDERCWQARRNLETLNGRSRQLFQKSDGEVVRMDDAERERQRAQMQQVIDKDCR